MAEQTQVTGFFPVVKNSKLNFGNHPAKRRKVEVLPVEMQHLSKQRIAQVKSTKQKSSKRVTRATKISELPVSNLPSAAPIETKGETTSSADGHSEPKRKISLKQEEKRTAVEAACSSGLTEKGFDAVEMGKSYGKMKQDPWITEQAKLVLAMGRGNAAVKASQAKEEKTKSLKASDIFNSVNPAKEEANKGNVREEFTKKFHESIKQEKIIHTRGRLREKYSHLLKTDTSNSLSKIEPKPRDEKESTFSSNKNKRIPAHQRFKQLASKKSEGTFVLPQKYKSLLEMFRSADSVLFLLHRRSETCTFDRLKTSVQSMLGRKFTEKHLGQMKAVFPKGFIFRIEKNLRDLNGMPSKPQLTIDANFEEDPLCNNREKKDVSQTVLISRRIIFETSLVEITKKHHQKFLKKLNLKIDENELQRWHPHFKLEDVPDIEATELPKAAIAKATTSAKDILANNNCIPQVEKTLEKVAKKSDDCEVPKLANKMDCKGDSTDKETEKNEEKESHKPNERLKGVSTALLERIREKEMKKAELAMLRNPEQEKRLAMMSHLPDIVRTLKTYFTTERKAAIALEDCSVKFSESFGSGGSSGNVEEHIRLLQELVPDWLSVVIVRKCPYVKISKKADINDVLRKLAAIKDKESKG